MTHKGPAGLPPSRQRQFDALYPHWRAKRHPDAAPPTSAEWDYLQKALIKTYYVDGDRIDLLKQVAHEVMDEWVAAGDDPAKIRALRKADFRIR